MRSRLLALLAFVCLAVGCTRYEYDITQPADLATHIAKNEVTVPREEEKVRRQFTGTYLLTARASFTHVLHSRCREVTKRESAASGIRHSFAR